VSWKATKVEVAKSGDIGFISGTYEVTMNDVVPASRSMIVVNILRSGKNTPTAVGNVRRHLELRYSSAAATSPRAAAAEKKSPNPTTQQEDICRSPHLAVSTDGIGSESKKPRTFHY